MKQGCQRILKVAVAIWIILPFSGCSTASKEVKPDLEAPPYRRLSEGTRTEGSLWTGEQSRSLFFQDTKASHLGDIVTVHIIENATGTKDAQTTSARSSNITATTSALLGLPVSRLNRIGAAANFSDAFDGSGSTSRSGALTADVTAVVTAVFPNGNMAIEGKREVLINNEKEYISLSGVIRPEDIGPSNTVLSTFIADAKIEYTGQGVLNDKQGPGWLVRILDWIWPF
jgi:flagellar L-ring protein precursor FlgH